MKKIILSSLFALSLASAGGFTPALADHHECSCDKECTHQCSNGDHKDCACKTCDCGKGEKCKHGECSTKKAKQPAKKADAPKAGEANAH